MIGELTADRFGTDAWVVVAGRHITAMTAKTRRELVGLASRDTPLERASIGRVVRYRTKADHDEVESLLDRVGLRTRVADLPDGIDTTLRRGGEPLTVTERAQLKLARAMAGTPPLLILDHLDDQLDPDGRAVLRDILADYPGCVILCSSNPEAVLDCYDVWNVDELAPTLVIALRASEIPSRGPRRTTHLSGSETPTFGPPVFRSAVERAALRTRVRDTDHDQDDEADE